MAETRRLWPDAFLFEQRDAFSEDFLDDSQVVEVFGQGNRRMLFKKFEDVFQPVRPQGDESAMMLERVCKPRGADAVLDQSLEELKACRAEEPRLLSEPLLQRRFIGGCCRVLPDEINHGSDERLFFRGERDVPPEITRCHFVQTFGVRSLVDSTVGGGRRSRCERLFPLGHEVLADVVLKLFCTQPTVCTGDALQLCGAHLEQVWRTLKKL